MRYIAQTLKIGCAVLVLGATSPAQTVTWDTISTGCLRLVVGSNGEMGHNGIGKANMDYVAFGSDCDTTATVYLKSGGPFAVWAVNRGWWDGYYHYFFRVSDALYKTDTLGDSWVPIAGTGEGHFTAPAWDGYCTGNFRNHDNRITMRRTYYAPTGGGDSCRFILVKSEVVNIVNEWNVNMVLGEQIDWDIPSNVPGLNSSATIISGYNQAAFQQGTGTGIADCSGQTDSSRFAALMYLNSVVGANDTCLVNSTIRSLYTELNDTFYVRNALPDSVREHSYFDYFGSRQDIGATAISGNQRTVLRPSSGSYWTVLATTRSGGLSELDHTLATARAWYEDHFGFQCVLLDTAGCCVANSADGRTGNVDCDNGKGVDISDLAALIDHLYLTFKPLCCPSAADLIQDDANVVIDIADLADLIDFLYIRFSPTVPCR